MPQKKDFLFVFLIAVLIAVTWFPVLTHAQSDDSGEWVLVEIDDSSIKHHKEEGIDWHKQCIPAMCRWDIDYTYSDFSFVNYFKYESYGMVENAEQRETVRFNAMPERVRAGETVNIRVAISSSTSITSNHPNANHLRMYFEDYEAKGGSNLVRIEHRSVAIGYLGWSEKHEIAVFRVLPGLDNLFELSDTVELKFPHPDQKVLQETSRPYDYAIWFILPRGRIEFNYHWIPANSVPVPPQTDPPLPPPPSDDGGLWAVVIGGMAIMGVAAAGIVTIGLIAGAAAIAIKVLGGSGGVATSGGLIPGVSGRAPSQHAPPGQKLPDNFIQSSEFGGPADNPHTTYQPQEDGCRPY